MFFFTKKRKTSKVTNTFFGFRQKNLNNPDFRLEIDRDRFFQFRPKSKVYLRHGTENETETETEHTTGFACPGK